MTKVKIAKIEAETKIEIAQIEERMQNTRLLHEKAMQPLTPKSKSSWYAPWK